MRMTDALIAELQIETVSTRRMLERVPEETLSWRPHDKSRTLGEVAAHIADLPGLFIGSLLEDEFDRYTYTSSTETVADILGTFDRNVTLAKEVLRDLSDEALLETWTYRYGERVVFELPRLVVIRTTALNHMIHHRGQLSVYLRLLDVPLPGVYGPTADES